MKFPATPRPLRSWTTVTAFILLVVPMAFVRISAAVNAQEGSGSPPKAEEILDKYLEVTGGKALYQSLKTIVSEGAFEIVGTSSRGFYTAYEAQPNKTRTVFEFFGGDKEEQGTVGDVAWARSTSDGPSLREGEEKTIALREATFNSMLNWHSLYRKAETTGTEKVGERPCYKVLFTPATGSPVTMYFDIESGFLVKSFITLKGPKGDIRSENLYDDYRESNIKILFPHRLAYRVGNEVIVVLLKSVRCNADIEWYRFDPPLDVKALQAKKHP